MKVLGLELSSSVGSIAFRDGNETIIIRQFPADRKHSGLFYENLSVLYKARGAPDVLAVGLGPGSYAGIRIAIATAIGLRVASRARIIGVPSVCAFDCAEYCIIGDARRSSFFFAHVIKGRCIEGPTLGTEENIRAKLNERRDLPAFTSEPLPQFENATLAHPSAMVLAELAEKLDPRMEEPLEPIYLREPYITTPKK
jgi:tRNA threonylcarbamoyladenosine biosynthesis protein TsaB